MRLSLEELAQVKVTTVSRKSENLSDAPAAVHVISQEDIRRSGVTSLAEALRMAPGLQVARANARKWAVSARGFNGTFSNKLLVLMDGRTLYTPLFSGVFWEETDTFLQDIDRIEVIRGPGATLWGANAVNGVINIITKSARQTQGTLLSGGGGIEERGFVSARHGGRAGENAYYRVYAKYSDRDDSMLSGGGNANDFWTSARTGFRVDWEPFEDNEVTFQGDYFYNDTGGRVLRHSLNPPRIFEDNFRAEDQGLNLLGRWTHRLSAESDLIWRTYYDRTDRGFGIGDEVRDTFDIEAQHRFPLGERQEIVWGGGYRLSIDDIGTSPDFVLQDPSKSLQLFSAFVQDEITVLPDRFRVIGGTKIEHHDFTGFEVQPSLRFIWTPHPGHSLWASVSRAVRTPSRTERGLQTIGGTLEVGNLPVVFPIVGNANYDSEELLAYELGYRVQPWPRLTLDSALFFHDYDRLRGLRPGDPELRFSPAFHVWTPLILDNDPEARSHGFELAASWQPLDNWRLRAGYTYYQIQIESQARFRDEIVSDFDLSPEHQVFAWSDLDLGDHVSWRFGFRRVGGLPGQQIPAYTELETRVAWQPVPEVEFAVVGHNLLQAEHREFTPLLIGARNTQAERALFATMTLRW